MPCGTAGTTSPGFARPSAANSLLAIISLHIVCALSGRSGLPAAPTPTVLPQKIISKSWHVFSAGKSPSNAPHLPRNPPQTHHQKTTARHYIFQKHPQKHEQIRDFSIVAMPHIFFEKLSRILRKIPHSKHMEILQPGLQYIDKAIVSIRIRRPEEKARFQHKVLGIADNPLNHLAVVKVHPNPQTRLRSAHVHENAVLCGADPRRRS